MKNNRIKRRQTALQKLKRELEWLEQHGDLKEDHVNGITFIYRSGVTQENAQKKIDRIRKEIYNLERRLQ